MPEQCTIVIPARIGSTRLPNKPLAPLAGVPLVVRVAQRVQGEAFANVVVATDSNTIAEVVRAHGFEALLTREDHPSGSDRIAEAADILGVADSHVLLNVQGDEPFVDVGDLSSLAACFDSPETQMATMATPFESEAEFENPNRVKVVTDLGGRALYFSRACIPHSVATKVPHPLIRWQIALRHLGVYAYRAGTLRRIAGAPPSPLETHERLEQLRPLTMGIPIHVLKTDHAAPGVDTPEDLAWAEQEFKRLQQESKESP